MKKKIIAVLIVIFLGVCAAAHAETIRINEKNYNIQANENYLYADLENDKVSIVLYIGDNEVVDLNNAFPGKNVTRVEDEAFLSDDTFLGEFHGKSYTINGKKYTCKTNLSSIVLPDSLEYIGYMSFEDNKLKTVEIPDGIKYIGYHSFAGNPIAVIPYIPKSAETNTPFSSSGVKTVTFDDRYESIPNDFLTFSGMKTLELHEGIKSIGKGAFYYCFMSEVKLPDSLKSIGSEAFSNTGLTKVVLPPNVSSVGDGAFIECKSLKSVELSDALTEINAKVFYNCSKLGSIIIKESVTKIGNEAFSGCKALAKIELPDSLTTIGNYAFYKCGKLKKIVIPANVTKIGIEAFSECKSLSSVTLPAGIENIADDAFDSCAKNITFEVVHGSYAEEWATKKGYKTKTIYPVEEIQLTETSVTINKGSKISIKATVSPKNATNKNVEWTTTDESVATVKNGNVVAVNCGECDVVCKAADGSGVQATIHINVIQMVQSLSFSEKVFQMTTGSKTNLNVNIKPSDATNQRVKYTSDNEEVCSVTEDGVLKAIGVGKCVILCETTDGSKKNAKLAVQVTAPRDIWSIIGMFNFNKGFFFTDYSDADERTWVDDLYMIHIKDNIWQTEKAWDIEAGVEFKIRKDTCWDVFYPEENYIVSETGTYYVQLNTETGEISLIPENE